MKRIHESRNHEKESIYSHQIYKQIKIKISIANIHHIRHYLTSERIPSCLKFPV